MSHDRDEGGARALPPRSAQIAQKWSELRDLAEFAPLLRKSYSRAAKNGVRHFQDRRLSSNLGDLSQLVQERALDDRAESSHLLVRGGPQAGEFEKKEVEESRSKAAQYLSKKSGQIQTNPEGWVRPHLPRGAAPPGAVLRARKGPCARSAFARARRSVASASLSLRDQETLPRGRLPRSLCSRRPCPANGCIRSLAHGRDHSAVSRASGSRCGLPNAPSGSPSEALRSPSRWAGKICIAAYKPSFLRFARRNDLALRTAQGEGEPLATARSRRVMGRSLRFALITKRPRPRMGGRGLEVSVCRGNLASTCPS